MMHTGVLRAYANDISRLQRLIDPLLLAGLFALCTHASGVAVQTERLLVHALLWVVVLSAAVLPINKLYQSYRQQSLVTLTRRLTIGWLMVLSGLMAVGFASKLTAQFSRQDLIAWALLSWLLLFLCHVGGRKLLRLHRIGGGNIRTLLYWGFPDAAIEFYRQLEQSPYLGLRLAVWFQPALQPCPPLPEGMPPCAGSFSEMRSWLDQQSVDQIVFSHVGSNPFSMADVLRFFGDTCLPVVYAPTWATPSMRFEFGQIGSQTCITLWRNHQSNLDLQLKRSFDLVLASCALMLLAPLLLLIALAIGLTSPGPILFRQDRYGLDGQRFKINKFRTMTVLEAGDGSGLVQASRHDRRVTPLGRILRLWSLDELPQLFNVLEGSMSLVGPRPHAVDHNEQYRRLIPGYMQRHLFKPGITGLAQVEGLRGETATTDAMAQRVEKDLLYQRNWSLAVDVKILMLTLLRIRSPMAY
jgi:putative colanic acid biosynthesis UDP-glucose lipid carrier transferase